MCAMLCAGERTPRRLAIIALLLAPWVEATAQSTVYRCTAPDGRIEFRQRPCQGHDQAQELQIQDNRTGWVPPEPTPDAAAGRKAPTPNRRSTAATANKDKYADRCWNKRQQIERTNAELRAGYSPERGERLKRRRREYEAFLNRYCR